MAKFYNNRVKSGRVAGSVFAVRNGEVIERAYNPIVANPNTPAQLENRAKLKLLSQLSAVFGNYIAMPRIGAVSARNRFVKENYGATTYASNEADITMTSVKLTKSVVALPELTATRTGFTIGVELNLADADINRIVYIGVVRQPDGTARVAAAAVVSEAGTNRNYPGTLEMNTTAPAYVFAYGVRDNTEAARVKFADMNVTAENIANVIVTRMLTEQDVTVTETQAVSVPAQA